MADTFYVTLELKILGWKVCCSVFWGYLDITRYSATKFGRNKPTSFAGGTERSIIRILVLYNFCISGACGQSPPAPLLRKFGNLSMRKILVVTSACARTDSGGGGGGRGGKSQGNPTGSGECHLFLAGNRAVLLGNRRFSWREIARPSSLLKKRFL